MASRGIIQNPIVQVALALIVVLVIATLTFASAISGALKIVRGKPIKYLKNPSCATPFLFVQTAEKLRKNLVSLNCYHGSRIARTDRTHVGFEEDRRLNPITFNTPLIISLKFR